MRIGLGVFIIAHGWVHTILAVAPNPGDPEARPGAYFTSANRSWLLPKLGLSDAGVQWAGIILVVLSTLGFVFAGMGMLGVAGISTIWRVTAVAAAIISLLLLVAFWHPWLPVGVLINVLVLVVLLWAKWPSTDLIGV
jgi:hypothetical protein